MADALGDRLRHSPVFCGKGLFGNLGGGSGAVEPRSTRPPNPAPTSRWFPIRSGNRWLPPLEFFHAGPMQRSRLPEIHRINTPQEGVLAVG
jgi:hypothetical protein